MQIFEVTLFFKLRTMQQKTVKPTYLCPLDARKLAEGKGHETETGVKVAFYRDLHNLLQQVDSKDKLLILGDFNASVGRDFEV